MRAIDEGVDERRSAESPFDDLATEFSSVDDEFGLAGAFESPVDDEFALAGAFESPVDDEFGLAGAFESPVDDEFALAGAFESPVDDEFGLAGAFESPVDDEFGLAGAFESPVDDEWDELGLPYDDESYDDDEAYHDDDHNDESYDDESYDDESDRGQGCGCGRGESEAGLDVDDNDYEVMAGENFPEPKDKGVKAAPAAPAGAFYPVRSTHPWGHIVDYTAADGRHVGKRPGRVFGAGRPASQRPAPRRHAGIDLYAKRGDEVIASQDGTIKRFYGFCCGDNKTTNALVVDHGDLVINYGEVNPNSLRRLGLRVGDRVQAGQVIATVGVNPGGSSMLHLEMYAPGVTRNKQWRSGRPAPDGLLDPSAYLAALAPTTPTSGRSGGGSGGGSSSGLRVLRRGRRGEDVEALQRALGNAGFPTAVDGVFGSQTKRRVEDFQRAHGLQPDGVVGARTRAALKAAASQEWPDPERETGAMPMAQESQVAARDFTTSSDLRDVIAGRLLLSKLGSRGRTPRRSRGPAIVIIQEALLQLGYRLPLFGADGDFGNETVAAVKRFQQDQGLTPDGIVGATTLTVLYRLFNQGSGRCGVPAPPMPRLEGAPRYWVDQLKSGSVGKHMRYLAGNRVEPLVDGVETFKAMERAIKTATGKGHYIYFLGWWCDPWVYLNGPGTSLLDLFASAGENGVQIRGLLWGPDWKAVPFRSQRKVNAAAAAALSKLPNTVFQDDTAPELTKSHHQKMMVVNGEEGLIVLQGGVDVNADRVHPIPPPPGTYRSDRPDLAWVSTSGSGSSGGGDGMPQHDVHCRLDGPVCLLLLRAFRRRWFSRSGSREIDRTDPLLGAYCTTLPATSGRQLATMGETFDAVLVDENSGQSVRSRRVTAQQIWLTALLGARRTIYIEEQYMSNPCAAEAINHVLPDLEHVIIVIPPSELTDFPNRWKKRKKFIEIATRGHSRRVKDKLRVYTPVRGDNPRDCDRDGGPWIYLHSKMAVIDDELVLIGSANMNHRGWETDSELVIATIEQDADNVEAARALRKRLWSKHLQVSLDEVDDVYTAAALWDSAPDRRVCRYELEGDPSKKGGQDDRWDDWKVRKGYADPTCVKPGDPCNEFLGTETTKGCAD